MADVVHFIQDMLFTSKVREVAKQLGVSVQGTREPAALVAAAREAKLVILDLRLPRALEALQALAAEPAPEAGAVRPRPRPRIVGFIDHEKTDVMEAARAAGCTDVMAKGQFANALPKLLAGLGQGAG